MRKQYVNLDWNPEKIECGRGVFLKASIDETGPPGSSEKQKAYFFIEPDVGNNMKAKFLPAGNRAVGFFGEPPHRRTVTIKDKKVTGVASVSTVGGDKFKFKVGQKDDKSDAKDYPELEIETWRKIFVRVGKMASCKSVSPGSLQGDFDPMFIELESEGAESVTDWDDFVKSPASVVSGMNKGKTEPVHPGQTAHVVFVDRIAEPETIEIETVYVASELKKSKVQIWKIQGDHSTWPDDSDWIVKGEIATFDDKGDPRMAWRSLGDVVSKATDKGEHHEHLNGFAVDHLSIDFAKLGAGLDEWVTRGDGILQVTLSIRVLSGTANGSADPRLPYLIVATRSAWTYKERSSSAIKGTLRHELGHQFGLALRYIPHYDEAKGEYSGRDQNIKWYDDAHGGRGNHCSMGANTMTNKEYEDGTCTMFHKTTKKRGTFCAVCKVLLKRANLGMLGRRNVWDPGMGWKESWTP